MKFPHREKCPKYPPKGQQFKCEECGLESPCLATLSIWKELFLQMTGRYKTYKLIKWHHLYEMEYFHHPRYSKKPYVYREPDFLRQQRSFRKHRIQIRYGETYQYDPYRVYFWLCGECFKKVKEMEEKLNSVWELEQKEKVREYKEEREKMRAEWMNEVWKNPDRTPLKGNRLQVWKWFIKNEGLTVEINYYSSEGERYCKNVEWIIECPKGYWFPGELDLRDKNMKDEDIHISENRIKIYWKYGTSDWKKEWTIKIIKPQRRAGLTELFEAIRNPKEPINVEQVVNDIEKIVRRWDGWQNKPYTESIVKDRLRKTLFKYRLHENQDLFDRVYGYIRQYY